MSLISLKFFVFCVLLFISFYAVPKKAQWIVLLLFSLAFYLFSGVQNIIYILITSLSSFFGALLIEKIGLKSKECINSNKKNMSVETKSLIKKKTKKKKKLVLVLILIINFGLLSIFKYSNFIIDQINSVIKIFGANGHINSLSLIVPLGISFYTFQTMGYLIDVYWDKTNALKNPLKMILFTSFFPQITQGPISNFNELSGELFKEHKFDYNKFVFGIERMIWGFFKKITIADLLSTYVSSTFSNYSEYTSITVLIGMFFYSIQIYADFSGYMDIVCGLCEIMDIKLTENFDRPYFSKSVAEYWRRWHISLGAWFKAYIYYPIAVSKWNINLGRKTSKKFGKHIGKNLPASLALIVVWFTTGLWHGASRGYIVWGGLNGFFIIFSMWMEPVYDFLKKKLNIRDSFMWRAFQTIRTFILVTFIKVLPEVGSLKSGLKLWRSVFINTKIPRSFSELLPYSSNFTLYVIIFGTILIFVVSLIQRKEMVRTKLDKLPVIIRLFILSVLITISLIVLFYQDGGVGGFMYAQF